MTAVLAEIERQKRAEQIAQWTKNEATMLEFLVPLRSIDLAEHREFIGPFLEFCSKRAVRHCPARPAVVATYLADCAYRGEDFALKTIDAIEALHEHHGLSNPIATRLVTVALDKIVTVEPPRWPKEDKILFARLPTPIKLRIAERETQRDNALRQSQNKLAEERKALEQRLNGESKTEKANGRAPENRAPPPGVQ